MLSPDVLLTLLVPDRVEDRRASDNQGASSEVDRHVVCDRGTGDNDIGGNGFGSHRLERRRGPHGGGCGPKMTENSTRSLGQADAGLREGEQFAVNLPIVGMVTIPSPERLAFYVGLILEMLLILGALLTSVVIVIRGTFNARQVMQDSIPIRHLVLAAAAVVITGLIFRLWVKGTTPIGASPFTAPLGALIGISATCCSIYFAVQSMVWLAHSNHAIAPQPAQSKLAIKDLYGKSTYEILDAVPLLKIPHTIGLEDPIPHLTLLGGMVLLVLKLLLLVGFARLFSQLWQVSRTRRSDLRRRIQTTLEALGGALEVV